MATVGAGAGAEAVGGADEWSQMLRDIYDQGSGFLIMSLHYHGLHLDQLHSRRISES